MRSNPIKHYVTHYENRLNSDGHRFDKYQNYKQPPLLLTERTEHNKTSRHMTLEILVLVCDRQINVSSSTCGINANDHTSVEIDSFSW